MNFSKDLLCLVADRTQKEFLTGLLEQLHSNRDIELEMARVQFEVHPNRDPGVYKYGIETIRDRYTKIAQRALVLLDYEGSGMERAGANKPKTKPKGVSAQAGKEELMLKVNQFGLEGRVEVFVIDPELEQWVWVGLPSMHKALFNSLNLDTCKEWLEQQPEYVVGNNKPLHSPKELFGRLQKNFKLPIDARSFYRLAQNLPYEKCTDPTFIAMKDCLKNWFPILKGKV